MSCTCRVPHDKRCTWFCFVLDKAITALCNGYHVQRDRNVACISETWKDEALDFGCDRTMDLPTSILGKWLTERESFREECNLLKDFAEDDHVKSSIAMPRELQYCNAFNRQRCSVQDSEQVCRNFHRVCFCRWFLDMVMYIVGPSMCLRSCALCPRDKVRLK